MPLTVRIFVSVTNRGPSRSRRDRGNRQHCDDESRRGRRHPPALDEQQHEQEERCDEAAGEQEQRGVDARQ